MQKRGFELIEHTADTGVAACGNSLPEAFANAAAGMFSIITDISRVEELEHRDVEVSAPDMETLLFNWLNELLFIFDVDHMLFSRFEVIELGDNHLKAVCCGEKYNPQKHDLYKGVKSATMHMIKVDRKENRVQVILDI